MSERHPARPPSAAFLCLALSLGGQAAAADTHLVRDTEPLTAEEELGKLQVPEGFEIQLFAAEPMINKPINLAFDARGRLWVSSTVEYPYAAKKERWADAEGSRVKDSRDAIKILEDTDGDGRADKVIDFADGLNIPTGVVPWHKPEHKDGCIAWSIPNIWYFADTDGDGQCDLREVLFGPLGYEKDTHGMCSSFRLRDGWVYATHGFNNTSRLVAKDGSTLEMHSGNVFRFRPDGSRVEIWSRGQVNPFGLCFDRRGNLYSADCHSAPVYQLLRGAHYPSFGKPHGGLGFGPAMIEHNHGSTGICGIAYIDRGVWGESWDDHVLIGNPVTSRVNLDRVEFAGSTPKAIERPDFVTSDDPWFRPVDLCLGSDGALYIADFYNRIIGHYEVPLDHPGRDRERGRIWRVVRKGGARPPAHAEEPSAKTYPPAALGAPSPFVRRAAAEQFGARPAKEALAPLIAALAEVEPADTHLRHTLRLAIREHLSLPGAIDALDVDAPAAAITEICLAVHSADAATFLARQLASGAPPDAVGYLEALTHIGRNAPPEILAEVIRREARKGTGDPAASAARLGAISRGLEEAGAIPDQPPLLDWGQKLARKILNGGKAEEADWSQVAHPDRPDSASPWTLQPRQCGDGKQAEVLSSLLRAGGDAEQRVGILRSRAFAAPDKLSFWLCGHRGHPGKAAHEKNFVRLVDAAHGTEIRRSYPPRSDVCARVEWDLKGWIGKPVRLEIVDGDQGGAYAWLGVTRFGTGAPRVSEFRAEDGRSKALRELASLLKVTAPADLRDQLRPYLPPTPAPPPPAVSAEDRAQLDAAIRQRVAEFEKAGGDPAMGGEVFAAHCAVCHQIDGKGGLVGPQLDGIGARGAARLCEDILDPNRNVDAHFLMTAITMKDGSSAAGIVRGESGALVLLTDVAGNEHRLRKDAVAKRETIPVSLMPAGFGERIGREPFRHLLAWLLEQRG